MGQEPTVTRQGLLVLRTFLSAPTRPLCGVDIIRATGLRSGTIYPLLLRFEHHGLVASAWEEAEPRDLGRPGRRLYSISPRGAILARDALAELAPPPMGPSWARA